MDSPREVTPNPWSNNKSCEPRLREGSLKTTIQKLKKYVTCKLTQDPKIKELGQKIFSCILFFILTIINHKRALKLSNNIFLAKMFNWIKLYIFKENSY